MSNDIVYRLREADAWFRSAGNISKSDPPTLLMQAIEEIKSLREEIERLREEVSRFERG